MRVADWLLAAILLCVFAFCAVQASGAEKKVNIAAASDLSLVMKEMAPAFERQTGYKALVSFGSSGNFYAQILNGAPFDLFLSADTDYPRRLIAAGAADPRSLYVYAVGRLVLWIKAENLDARRQGLKVLLDSSIRKIAIANPEHAPYGRAAVAALRQAGIYERVKSKLVLGEDIAQAAQFVESGNADAGLISLSLTKAIKSGGVFVELPDGSYPPIEQAAVVLKSAPDRAGADAFAAFLKSEEAKNLLQRYGFNTKREKP